MSNIHTMPGGQDRAKLECEIYEVAQMADALAMAIAGMGKLAIEDGYEQLALQALADELRFKAHALADPFIR